MARGGVEKVVYSTVNDIVTYTNKCKSCGKVFAPSNNPGEWMDGDPYGYSSGPYNNDTITDTQTTQQSTIQITTTITPSTPSLKSVKTPNM